MKTVIVLFLFVLSNSLAFSQSNDSIRSIINQSIELAKQESLYSDEINWDSLSQVINLQVDSIKSMEEIAIPFTTLINGMRDHHARFMLDNKFIAFFNDYENTRKTDYRILNDSIWHLVNYESKHEFEVINDSIGYIKIAGIGPCDIANESKKMRSKFDSIANLGAKTWIIDLRYNGGGNMYPMLACLAPLFKDGIVGFNSNLKDERIVSWEFRSGNFYYDEYVAVELPISNLDFSTSKVVVLTSRYTVSSGEVVTTAFNGRENTVSIGEDTGGYTTVTNWRYILDNLIMSISVGYYTNRLGYIYKNKISPDFQLEFKVEKDKNIDEGILQAIERLKK